ncbi:MAG: hypothetical protein AAF401_06740 [Pseudomonadota bacterium]
MKADGIPFWMTVFGALLAMGATAMGVVGVAAPWFVPNYIQGVGVEELARGWGARQAGVGLAMALAIYIRHAAAYAAAFFAGVVRDVADVATMLVGDIWLPGLFVLFVILVLELVCFATALRVAEKRHMHKRLSGKTKN